MKGKKLIQLYTWLLVSAVLVPVIIFSKQLGVFSPQKVILFEIIIEALIPVYIFLLVNRKELRPNLKKAGVIVLLTIFAWTLVSSFLGVDILNSLFGNTRRYGGLIFQLHLVLFIFYLLAAFKLKPHFFKKTAKASIGIAVLVSIYGILESLGFITVHNSVSLPRASSTFGNPIFFASYLFIPLTFSILFLIKEKMKWPYLISLLIILLGLYSAGTRGAYVGLIAGFSVGALSLLALNRNKKIQKVSLVVISTIILLSTTFFIFQSSTQKRATNFSVSSIKDRLRYWDIATKVIYEAPIFGVGNENFYRLAEKYYKYDFYDGEGVFVDKPHNQFLETFATTGIPGAVLYLVFFGILIKLIFQRFLRKEISLSEMAVLLGGLVAYHVQNAFVFTTVSAAIMFSLFVAYLLSFEQDFKKTHSLTGLSAGKSVLISSVLFPVILICIFHQGVIADLHSIEKSKKAPTTQLSLEQISRSQKTWFHFDNAAIAAEYSDIMVSGIGSRVSNEELYNKLLLGAEQYYKSAIRQHPNRGELYYHLSRAYMMRALATGGVVNDKEIKYLEKAIELMPERIEPRIVGVDILDINGNREGAIVEAHNIYNQTPLNPNASWTLAVLYLKDGDDNKAAQYGLEALDNGISPNSSIELMHFFNYYIDKNELNTAVRFVKRAIETESQNLQLLTQLAATYAANGQTEKAIETAKKYIEKNPSEKESGQAFINQLLNK
jgi:O-antigen ligase/tetratricopeptide (TPR) repeat protein